MRDEIDAAYWLRWDQERWGSDLVRSVDGAEIANDYGEPEDKSFGRDFAQVVKELNSLADRLKAAESSLREAREEAEGLRRAVDDLVTAILRWSEGSTYHSSACIAKRDGCTCDADGLCAALAAARAALAAKGEG